MSSTSKNILLKSKISAAYYNLNITISWKSNMTATIEQIRTQIRAKEWSDQEFMALPDDGNRYEIINGELVNVGNSGMEHGNIGIFLGGLIEIFVRQHNLGVTCDSSTAFKLKAGNKRSPDISFVSKERLIGLKRIPKGFFEGAPDLVVEIISPGNTFEEIHNKIEEYFESGTKLLWIIHPDEKYVLVYHSPQPDRLLRSNDFLDGEDQIVNFKVLVSDLFRTLEF
jgi:Uma2 family endonuclease